MKRRIYLIYLSGLICIYFHDITPSATQRSWIGRKWDAGRVAAQRAWRAGKGVLRTGKAYIGSAVSPYVSMVPLAGTTAAIVYFATDPKFVTAAVKDPGLIAVIAMLAGTGLATTLKMESLMKASVPEEKVLEELLTEVGTPDKPIQYYGSDQDKNYLGAYFIAELKSGINKLQISQGKYKLPTKKEVESKKIIAFGKEKGFVSHFKLSKNKDKISLEVDLIGEYNVPVSLYKSDILLEEVDNEKIKGIAQHIVQSIVDYGETLRKEASKEY